MKRFQYRFIQRAAASSLLVLAAVGCSDSAAPAPQQVAVTQQPLFDELAKQCGLECPAKGIVDGNAQISGVASVDAFFGSVVNFQAAATGASGDIDAQLQAIRGDFGIAANADFTASFDAAVKANLEGGLKIEAEPAKCSVDAKATLQAEARCDVSVDPGKAMVACKGGCDVKATAMAKCDASADLKCTVTAPSVACTGMCKGSCTADFKAGASCSGTCQGECSGNCSAYVKDASNKATCNGSCDAMCTGSCKTEFAAEAMCSGTCEGECTVTKASGGCEGGIKASCEAKANATVMCDGKCEGTFDPPKAKAECEASAKADAQVNVQCTPPRVAISYQLKVVTGAQLTAQAQFVAGLKNLQVRLPGLLASLKRASSVSDAGAGLAAAGKAAVTVSVKATAAGKVSVKDAIGLACAVTQLGDVETAISGAAGTLAASLTESAKFTSAFGVAG
ncbi:MAG TPA: hypothetical protein VF331_27030 [Polyangiales bacterium]